MNFCAEIGRLASQPDLRTTSSGKSVCSFRIAVKKGREETDFFSVVSFNDTAEFIRKYFKLGDLIEIQGKLAQRRWQKNGINYERVEIIRGTAGFVPQNKENTKTAERV